MTLEETLALQIGGAGLPEPERQYKFSAWREYRADFPWPHASLLVEIEGGTWAQGGHVRGARYEVDCDRQNAAQAAGWVMLRFTGHHIEDGRALAWIEALLSESGEEDMEALIKRRCERCDRSLAKKRSRPTRTQGKLI